MKERRINNKKNIYKDNLPANFIWLIKYPVYCLLILIAFIIPGCKDNGENIVDPFNNSEPINISGPAKDITQFELILEKLRRNYRIPAFSAAITKDGKIVWAQGFGYAYIETGKKATPSTSYHLASLTKTFASTIVMQLVEEGLVNLDDPVSKYGITLESQGTVLVKHIFSHTSEGIPGTYFRYNGGRFGMLDYVISGATNKSFCELLNERIISVLNLQNTAPNILASNNCMLRTAEEKINFAKNLAEGYASDGTTVEGYPTYFGTAAGLISSVLDVAKYSIAIDNNVFLKPETKELAFSPFISNSGEELPYGLGWFIYKESGLRIIWHYGYWTANSSLIIKVPDKKLAFVILANSDKLSSASNNIGIDGNLRRSIVAGEFLDAFVFGNAALPDIPYSD